jgi:hypothetical protein
MGYDTTDKMLELWCKGTNLPGVALVHSEVRRFGYGNFEKKPHVSLNNDVNLQFISDAGASIWTFFQQWMRLIVNYDVRNGIAGKSGVTGQTPYEVTYKDKYISNVNIIVFDQAGNVAVSVVLREAYPIFIGDIQLNWEDNNQAALVPVTFTMFDWYNERVQTNYGAQTVTAPDKPNNFLPPAYGTQTQMNQSGSPTDRGLSTPIRKMPSFRNFIAP